MAEYINREVLLQKAWDADTRVSYVQVVDVGDILDMPVSDVVPVVHWHWVHLGGDEWCCSVCSFVISTEGSWDKPTKKYCEDCGAKMDKGDNNDECVD